MSSDENYEEEYDSAEDKDIDIDKSSPTDSFKSEIQTINNSYNQYYNNERITKPFLTKFERAKIIGTRSEMIANGSVALIAVPPHIHNAYDIAKMEFLQKKIPLMIKRHLPNGKIELWRLSDLQI
jgi:DNA-directed RNA polymerase subunit K/omega